MALPSTENVEVPTGTAADGNVRDISPCATVQSTDLATQCREVSTPQILRIEDKEKHARSLGDAELLGYVKKALHSMRDNLPYLREARDRFAKPGQRVPEEGNPTWTQWVKANLTRDIRSVQRWLQVPKPKSEKKTRPVKSLKDWPAAMRSATDLVAAIKRLHAKTPIGADVLVPALRELATITGCRLMEPQSAPLPKSQPKATSESAPPVPSGVTEVAPDVDEHIPRLGQPNADFRGVLAKYGWDIDENGRSEYQGMPTA
jgi:hypothetical protein